ncbi:MAG: hypothetical protein DCC69_07715 [Hyphomicrobiales bacterium]|nr:MAG: hypothetical protein DCC69_07715 [Hyphomicrobiales bacterium]
MRMSIGLAAAVAAVLLAASPAAAGDGRDRVHADSFGNLVIHSAAGYKRIIVGMGHVAEAYQLTGSYYEPENVEAAAHRPARRCWRPPYVWHGRSHMYGLREGEVPQAPLVCE